MAIDLKYTSNPFQPGGQQRDAGVAAVFAGQVRYFFSGPNSTLGLLSFEQSFVAEQDFTDTRAWSLSTPSLLEGGAAAAPISSGERPAAAAVGEALHLLWSEKGSKAIKSASLAASGSWSAVAQVWTPKFSQGAVSFGQAQLTAASIAAHAYGGGLVLSWVAEVGSDRYLINMLLDPTSIADGVWVGEAMVATKIRDLDIAGNPGDLSTAWVTQGSSHFMAVVLFDLGDGEQSVDPTLLSIGANGLPDGVTWMQMDGFGTIKRGVALGRGLTGELRAHYVDSERRARAAMLLGNVPYSQLVGAKGRVAWSSDEPLRTDPARSSSTFESEDFPVFIHVGSAGRPDQDGAGEATTAFDVYAMVFYGAPSSSESVPISAFVVREGAIEMITQSWDLPNFATSDEPPLLLTGVFDAPVPIPSQNLVALADGGSVTETMLSAPMSTVEYGMTESTGSQRSVELSATVGIRSSGTFTKGVGPAWDLSMRSTMGLVEGSSTSQVWETAQVGETWIEQAGAVISATAPSLLLGEQPKLVQRSLVFVNTDQAVDRVTIGGVSLEKFVPVVVQGTAAGGLGSGRFMPFTVVPGDLYSYTRDEVNARVNAAFAGVDPTKAPLFAGSESVYSGDYVGWLESQAIPLGQEAKYLEIVANNAGGQATTFEASNTTFQEWSWSFDVSAYAGVSGGGGVDFFGIGEEISVVALAGLEVHEAAVARTETSERWGITVKVGFPGGAKAGHVTAYTTQVFLLPANELWTREVVALSKWTDSMLDTSAAPWRIFFLVEPLSLRFVPGEVPGTITSLEAPTANFPASKIGVASANNGGGLPARYWVHATATVTIDGAAAALGDLRVGDAAKLVLDGSGVTAIAVTRGASA